jgi:hypothetical protein
MAARRWRRWRRSRSTRRPGARSRRRGETGAGSVPHHSARPGRTAGPYQATGRQRRGRAAGERAGRGRAGGGAGGLTPLDVPGRLPRRRQRGDPAAGRRLGGLLGRPGSRPGRPRLGGQPGDGGAATPATTNIAGVIVLLPATASDSERAEGMCRSTSADGAGVAIRQVRPVLLRGMAVGHSTRRRAPAGAVSEGHQMAEAHSRSLVSILTR